MPDVEAPGTVQELLTHRSRNHPDAIAIIDGDGEALTYEELRVLVFQLSSWFESQGVRGGSRVGILAPTGAVSAVIMLTAMVHGSAAPLAPSMPWNAVARASARYRLSAVLVSEALAVNSSLPLLPGTRVIRGLPTTLRKIRALAGVRHDGQSEISNSSQDEALLVATSGTTSGCPRAVSLSHSLLLNGSSRVAQSVALSSNDRCLCMMPLHHTHGLIGAVLSSVHSGASVICTNGFDPKKFGWWLARQQPTWYTAVPTIHRQVLDWTRHNSSEAPHELFRLVRSTSAPLPEALMRELEETLSVPVIEAWGLTEASGQVTTNPLPPGRRKPGSVGVPKGGFELTLRSTSDPLQPPPVGGIGEVCIRGPGVVRGYWDDDAATRERFFDGWLLTGDLARLDEDGYLYLKGRTNDVVNRAGEKILVREIEERLVCFPGIRDVAGFSIEDEDRGEELALAVEPWPNSTVSPSGVAHQATRELGPLRSPRFVYIVAAIPKNDVGKTDRVRLKSDFLRMKDSDSAVLYDGRRKEGRHLNEVTTTDTIVGALLGIWNAALGLPEPEATAPLGLFGLDSLLAMRLAASIRVVFNVEVPFETFFSPEASLSDIAKWIVSSRET